MSGEPKTKTPLTYALPILLVIVVGVAVTHFMLANKTRAKKVFSEDLQCISAVCITDGYGIKSCIEVKPQVARIVVSPEFSPSDPMRLNTILEGKPCSTEE